MNQIGIKKSSFWKNKFSEEGKKPRLEHFQPQKSLDLKKKSPNFLTAKIFLSLLMLISKFYLWESHFHVILTLYEVKIFLYYKN